MTVEDVVRAHQEAGRAFEVDGVGSFVREQGDGEAVVCMHGVPASCFLYRTVIAELAARGLRGVAFDLPGLGLADRPEDFDYSWTGLGRFSAAAIDRLGIERFHLVIHDIGGPVGLEVACAMPERVRTLTLLNTLVEPHRFRPPWSMRPFRSPLLGPLWLGMMFRPIFLRLMYLQGIGDRDAVAKEELLAYHALLLRSDRGRAFLRIMRGFELTQEKTDLYATALRDVPYPVQIIWGDRDPALKVDHWGEIARQAANLDSIHRVPGKHFLQEDQAGKIAEHIAELANTARAS